MAKKVIAVNGSPRKKWNTATLLEHALAGAAEAGAETELLHLYDLDFKGCFSCFACKTLAGWRKGVCVVRDGLSPVLEKLALADAVFIGSPVYLGTGSGEMRSFLERFTFPWLTYENPPGTVFPRVMPVGFFYTMNVAEKDFASGMMGMAEGLAVTEMFAKRLFGHAETLYCFDTLQFNDYGKVHAPRFDGDAKAERRRTVFPADCEKARDMGRRFAAGGFAA